MNKENYELRWSLHKNQGEIVEKGSGGLHEQVNYLALKYSGLGELLRIIEEMVEVDIYTKPSGIIEKR